MMEYEPLYSSLPSDETPVLTTKDELRAEIAKHTAEFLANGGEITVLPYDWKAELEDRAASRVMYAFDGYASSYQSEDNAYGLDDDDIVEDFEEPYG